MVKAIGGPMPDARMSADSGVFCRIDMHDRVYTPGTPTSSERKVEKGGHSMHAGRRVGSGGPVDVCLCIRGTPPDPARCIPQNYKWG
jgi:hypothetical protein